MSRRFLLFSVTIVWWLVLGLALAVFAVSKWEGYASLQIACEQPLHCENPMRLTEHAANDLAAYGITASLYSALLIIFMSISNLSYFSVAVLLYHYGRRDPFCLAASIFLIITGTIFCTDPLALQQSPVLLFTFHAMDAAGSFYLPFLFLFPDGRFTPKWTLIPSAIWVGAQSYRFIVPEHWAQLNWDPVFMTVLLLSTHGPFLLSLRDRMRHTITVKERRNLKWFAISLLCYVFGGLLLVLPYLLQDGLVQLVVQVIFFAALMFWPVAIGIGVLEHRLQKSTVALHRTIVFTTLSFLITLLYAFSVGGFSILLRGDNVLVSLLASGVIAVLFHPIHLGLQRGINRLVYGDPENPYLPLTRMIAQVETIGRAQSVWTDIVIGIAQALSLTYACLYTGTGAEKKVAEFGDPHEMSTKVPLEWEGKNVGALVIHAAESLNKMSIERLELLHHLIRQISFALYAERLNEQLRESKERLVHTREEERRRLRRDLHDGLGAHLASILLKTEVIADRMENNTSLQRLVTDVQEGIESAIADIRSLVYALRPPVLDEFGLLFALQELALRFSEGGKEVRIIAAQPLPPLSAATEVAMYRIVQEAITNSFRHGGASRCQVELMSSDGLRLTIADNGKGFESPVSPGVGIRSMKERAEELGGCCQINSTGQGTTVQVMIPAAKEAAGNGADSSGN
ncbi:sensor histidine kinase [Paenibacillus beijingensis]|nr:sensor histidine kinase [Paenibacillus beijingensis]